MWEKLILLYCFFITFIIHGMDIPIQLQKTENGSTLDPRYMPAMQAILTWVNNNHSLLKNKQWPVELPQSHMAQDISLRRFHMTRGATKYCKVLLVFEYYADQFKKCNSWEDIQ